MPKLDGSVLFEHFRPLAPGKVEVKNSLQSCAVSLSTTVKGKVKIKLNDKRGHCVFSAYYTTDDREDHSSLRPIKLYGNSHHARCTEPENLFDALMLNCLI
jgi:hypothetical protein